MKCRLLFAVSIMLLLTGTWTVAQQDSASSADVAFWVAYWARPRVAMYGPDEEAFNQNMYEVMFPGTTMTSHRTRASWTTMFNG